MNAQARILVVDDEDVVRRSFARALAATPCRVETASSWTEVARLMQQQKPYDVVLLDLRMPDTDGITILRAIKQRWPDSEVVVITGYPTLETAKQAVSLGAYDYLMKPIGPQDLIDVAEAAVQHKRWALHRDPAPSNDASAAVAAAPATNLS